MTISSPPDLADGMLGADSAGPRVDLLADLDVRQLRAFLAVVELGTFGRAAEELGFTQSAVSQQIASLERLVGLQLFDRPGGPRPVVLTSAGRLLERHAHGVLDQVSALESAITGHVSGTAGRIDIAVFQSVAVKVLPTVVGRLRREAEVDVRPIEIDDDHRSYDLVEKGKIDASFVATKLTGSALVEHHSLISDPFVLVAPVDDRPDDVVTARELAQLPLIGQPISNTCQLRVDAALLDIGVRPDYVFRTHDNAALQSMVREGMGVAVMPLLAVDINDPRTRICRMDPELPHRDIGLITSAEPAPLVRRLVEISREVCREAVAALAEATDLA